MLQKIFTLKKKATRIIADANFSSPRLNNSPKICWKDRGGELFWASFLNEAFRLLYGFNFLPVGLAESSHIKQGRYKYILQLWPCKLWSFLRLTSIAHYEMKQGAWHLHTVSQFRHQPGLGIDWEVWGWPVAALQCVDPEACMSNTSLWASAINLWNGARTGEENWETALDFLTSCWIKKQWEALFLPDKGLIPSHGFPKHLSPF